MSDSEATADRPYVLDAKLMSELGIITAINDQVLHPLGLALYWDKDKNQLQGCFVSPDGVYEYPEDSPSIVTKRERFAKFCECMKHVRKVRSINNDTTDVRPMVVNIVADITRKNSK